MKNASMPQASAQIAYVNHFTNPGQYQYAEELFKRFLLHSPAVDLWKVYVTYVRRMNARPEARETVKKAYEFAVSHVGHDRDAGEIWVEFIRFIQQGEVCILTFTLACAHTPVVGLHTRCPSLIHLTLCSMFEFIFFLYAMDLRDV